MLPKPRKRYRASSDEWDVIWEHFAEARCWVCGARPVTDLHHILPRDGNGTWPGGDDTIPNLAPLCRTCHRMVEDRNPVVRALLRRALTDTNLDYLELRLGDPGYRVWLDRHLPAERAA